MTWNIWINKERELKKKNALFRVIQSTDKKHYEQNSYYKAANGICKAQNFLKRQNTLNVNHRSTVEE